MELATGRFGNLLKLELVDHFEDPAVSGCFHMTNETPTISVAKRRTELGLERERPVFDIFLVVLHELIHYSLSKLRASPMFHVRLHELTNDLELLRLRQKFPKVHVLERESALQGRPLRRP